MITFCDACGSKGGNSWMSYHGIFSRDKQSLQKFIAKKSGKNKDGDDFELCGNCNEEWKKVFSQELKEEIIKELRHRKSVEYLEDYNNNYWKMIERKPNKPSSKTLNVIKTNEKLKKWIEIEMANTTMMVGREREREKKINKQTILLHQSAQIEYSENGFLIIRPPKMYRKDYFPPEQWTEIEKVLNQESQTTKNQPAGKQTLIICGVIFLIIGIIILLIYLIRKRKQK